MKAESDGLSGAVGWREMRGSRDCDAFISRCDGLVVEWSGGNMLDPPWTIADAMCGLHVGRALQAALEANRG